jgi:phenylpropionate dioxygenase-like ring-hydroxylating dioxygenase large terminal subunit
MTSKIDFQGDMDNASVPLDQHKEEVFQWTKQWYPVAVVDFLDPSRPHAIQLLGKDLVLWRDSLSKWSIFEDCCPHRLAPLSEGRVESDGTLLCAYHAWRFDSQGNCVSIP